MLVDSLLAGVTLEAGTLKITGDGQFPTAVYTHAPYLFVLCKESKIQ